ncbi:UNVERIFIED_CONTAM: hypothetical protein FKN15_037467 [Acipenser sinensis]
MASNLWSEDQFSCSVCLDLLKDPVITACGHSYCMGCIKNCWDQNDHTGVYSCPQCRKTFTPRPVLCRNTMLDEVVEKLKKTGLSPPPAQSYAGPGDVTCDFCTGRKFKAVKSCLTCLASYCETHVKPHYEGAAFKRHKLINAIGNIEQKLCAEHQRLCEVFCRTDQMCICLLCSQNEHKSHDTVSAEVERTGKQRYACIEINESEKIFTELIQSIEKIHTEVIEQIGANEKAAVNQVEGRMKKLEQEIAELRRRNAELKQLSETEDHIHFLQNFQSLCAPLEAGDLPSITVNTDISFGAVRKAVSELKDHIEDFCKGGFVKITKTDSCQLTLDPNTAHRNLCLSEGNRKVTLRGETQRYPDDHQERFHVYAQVLCREGLYGTRCYWEIEWSGGWPDIGVTYNGISRKGVDRSCGLGYNDKSWSLSCSDSRQSEGAVVSMEDTVWLVAITFLTIGYGDLTPKTTCGKTVCLLTGVMGVGCTAMLVAVVSNKLVLNKAEKHVHQFMMDTKYTKKIRNAAANVLMECWLLHRSSRGRRHGGEHRRDQRRLLKAIQVFWNARFKQRKKTDHSNKVVDLLKHLQKITCDLNANWSNSYKELEQRIDSMEQKMDALRIAFHDISQPLSRAMQHRAEDYSLT